MQDICGILISRFEIVGLGEEILECLRPLAHNGPHVIQQANGDFVTWEDDQCEPGTCEYCDGEDTDDWCLAYDTISKAEAERLIADGALES